MTLKEIEKNIQELAAEMAMSIIKHMGVTVTIAGMRVDIDNIEKEIDGIKVEINGPVYADGVEYDLVEREVA